jgi:prepilin-type N-terminal cleavage/methylation domain-containing protein
MSPVQAIVVTLSRSEAEARGPKPYRSAGGFTLIEILLTLVIAGTAALMAHALFSAAVDGSADLRAARASLDRAANTRRFLAATFLSLETGSGGAGGFSGQRERMRFAAWIETADGWFERRDVALALDAGRLVASIESAPALLVADGVARVEFDYLLLPGADAGWVGEWISPVSAPLAVRIRLTRRSPPGQTVTDTTLYVIRARG